MQLKLENGDTLQFLSNNQILNQTFVSSLNYKVQSQYSETIKLENSSIQDLIDKTYKDLLVKLAQNINT